MNVLVQKLIPLRYAKQKNVLVCQRADLSMEITEQDISNGNENEVQLGTMYAIKRHGKWERAMVRFRQDHVIKFSLIYISSLIG